MSASDPHENDLDSLPTVEPPAAVRNDARAVRTVIVPDPGYDGIAHTKCRCGKWFHTGWFQRHNCTPVHTGMPAGRRRP